MTQSQAVLLDCISKTVADTPGILDRLKIFNLFPWSSNLNIRLKIPSLEQTGFKSNAKGLSSQPFRRYISIYQEVGKPFRFQAGS